MISAKKLRAYFQRLFRKTPQAREIVSSDFIKAQIPVAAFTRTGPGIRAALRGALKSLSARQLQLARAKGWDKNVLTKEDLRIHTLQLAAQLQAEAKA